MNPRAVLMAACTGLAVTPGSLYVLRRSPLVRRREQAGRDGAVITVGSFDFPESVLLAQIYGQALAGE